MSEKFYKRRAARERLNVTKYGYFRLIEQGILAAPIRLAPNAHPLHTESQLRAAENKISELANPAPKPRRSKPLSQKMIDSIRDSYS